jgi:hypothetical protein
MSSNPLTAGSRLEPSIRHRLALPSIPKRKRDPRPLPGGETEWLERLGEIPKRPREDGLGYHDLLARRWL